MVVVVHSSSGGDSGEVGDPSPLFKTARVANLGWQELPKCSRLVGPEKACCFLACLPCCTAPTPAS